MLCMCVWNDYCEQVIKYIDVNCIAIELINCPSIAGDIKIVFKTSEKNVSDTLYCARHFLYSFLPCFFLLTMIAVEVVAVLNVVGVLARTYSRVHRLCHVTVVLSVCTWSEKVTLPLTTYYLHVTLLQAMVPVLPPLSHAFNSTAGQQELYHCMTLGNVT